MRILFLLILLANLGVYALGQGWLGVRPEDAGREPQRLKQERNTKAIIVMPAH
jgi:hypothetical protein